MAQLSTQCGLTVGLLFVHITAFLSLVPFATCGQASLTSSPNNESGDILRSSPRVPHLHAYRVAEDIEDTNGEASAEWLQLYAHLPLLKLALPATYMSTLTDVNVQKYVGKVEAQHLGVADQLKDGIRLLDVRLWRGQNATGQPTTWFTEVPWRLFEDMEVLRRAPTAASREALLASAEAQEVHSRSDLEESLFKPVLQFLRKSVGEVVVVVFSAVNGNVHTINNVVAKGSELAESLSHAEDQLQAFLQSGAPYSDNEQEAELKNTAEDFTALKVLSPPSHRTPLFHSFVKKGVSFKDFADITGLIDKYWGQLLPRHMDKFPDSKNEQKRMRDSRGDPTSFRQWQRREGASLLGKPIGELRAAYVRLILLVDDPLLAWFITTRSRSQVVAFVKADHLYDVSYKSESHFAPCASPHTAILGKPTKTQVSGWPSCRSWCNTMGTKDCLTWVWKPSQDPASGGSRQRPDLGSTWDQDAGEESGQCELFTSTASTLSFEAIAQEADCPFADLHSSVLPWDPKAVSADLIRSAFPMVALRPHGRIRRRSKSSLSDLFFGFDPRVSLLATGFASGHERKYRTSEKLLRVLFAPPTPQVRIEAAQRPVHSSASDVVPKFNATLAEYLQWVLLTYHFLEKTGYRVINAIQISKYNRIRSDLAPFAASSFFEHMMVLNPSGAIDSHLLAIPQGNLGYFLGDSGLDRASKGLPLATGNAHVTMWMCFLGVVTTISLWILLSTFWCSCHPGGLFQKICQRRAAAAGPPETSVEVFGIPRAGVRRSVGAG